MSDVYDFICGVEAKMEIDSLSKLLEDQVTEMFEEWQELEDEFD